jgi:hypothetical protein
VIKAGGRRWRIITCVDTHSHTFTYIYIYISISIKKEKLTKREILTQQREREREREIQSNKYTRKTLLGRRTPNTQLHIYLAYLAAAAGAADSHAGWSQRPRHRKSRQKTPAVVVVVAAATQTRGRNTCAAAAGGAAGASEGVAAVPGPTAHRDWPGGPWSQNPRAPRNRENCPN